MSSVKGLIMGTGEGMDSAGMELKRRKENCKGWNENSGGWKGDGMSMKREKMLRNAHNLYSGRRANN